MGYYRAGFDVIGIDIVDQPNYPFEFERADALELNQLLWVHGPVDVIHASPPCQAYSTLSNPGHPELITPIRERIQDSGIPYVIENIVGAPLIFPVQLCGSYFGLGVQRHRLFESSYQLEGAPCKHADIPEQYEVYEHYKWKQTKFARVYGDGGRDKAVEHWNEAMGIDWMTRKELTEAIPPVYTEFIGKQILRSRTMSFDEAFEITHRLFVEGLSDAAICEHLACLGCEHDIVPILERIHEEGSVGS